MLSKRKYGDYRISSLSVHFSLVSALILGTTNRTIAATNMNATSSRAHTLVCISFDQISSEIGSKERLSSTINFVDLAGWLAVSL